MAALVLVLAAVLLTAGHFLSGRLDRELKERIQSGSDGLYRLDFASASLRLWAGSLALEKVSLRADTARYLSQVRTGTAPDLLAGAELERLSLEGISWVRLLFGSFSADLLRAEGLTIRLDHHSYPHNEGKPPRSWQDLLGEKLKAVRVKKTRIAGARLHYTHHREALSSRTSSLQNVSLRMDDFRIDRQTGKSVFPAAAVAMKADSLSLPYGDSLYHFRMSNLELDSSDSSFSVGRISFTPRFSREAFARKAGIAIDQFDLSYRNVSCSGTDIGRFLASGHFFSHRMTIDSGRMEIFRDTRYTRVAKNKVGTYPHQVLLQSGVRLHFDTVRINSIALSYAERSYKTGQAGAVQFADTKGYISNLTNDSLAIAKEGTCRVRVVTKVMNHSMLRAFFDFDLRSAKGDFRCGGQMKNFPMPLVSPVTRPLALAEVKSGQLNELDFEIRANDYASSITMHMLYSDLYLALMKVDREESRIRKRSLVTNLINNLILDDNNPSGKRPVRVARVQRDRAPDLSFFGFIWKTTLGGIREIVMGSRTKPGDVRRVDAGGREKKK